MDKLKLLQKYEREPVFLVVDIMTRCNVSNICRLKDIVPDSHINLHGIVSPSFSATVEWTAIDLKEKKDGLHIYVQS